MPEKMKNGQELAKYIKGKKPDIPGWSSIVKAAGKLLDAVNGNLKDAMKKFDSDLPFFMKLLKLSEKEMADKKESKKNAQ